MVRTCRVPYCGAPASSRYSPHCRRHKSTLRRQGGTGQTAITKAELAPYLASVQRRIHVNANSPLWGILDDTWLNIVSGSRTNVMAAVGNRYQRLASHEVINLAADASPREICITALAMFMLWHDRPNRFETDRAFRQQLVRRVRALSQRHVGITFDHRSGTNRRTYREISPRASLILATSLTQCFGSAGLQLANLDRRQRETAAVTSQNINQALKDLK